jgi:glycosyltransferase involved in cell wall biosynthesis
VNLVQITAGTGNYHCDTCLRDHALVRALRQQGHDVLLVPLYLPLVTELPEEGAAPLFLGGINAYLQQKLPLFRHTPAWVDRLFDARWLLRLAAGFADLTQPRDLGEMTVSTLRGLDGNQRKELHKLVAWLREHARPDAILLSNELLLGFAQPLREALGCPVLCSLQGADFFIDGLPQPYRDETWALLRRHAAHAAAFLAPSAWYAGLIGERLALPADRLHVVRNGLHLDDLLALTPQPAAPTIGYLSQMTRVKGLDAVVDAFILLKQRGRVPGLRLHVGGSIVPAWRRFVTQQERRLAQAGYAADARFSVTLERHAKAAFLRELSVFTVPVTFGEPFGLYAVEAMAAGLPVVEPARGAFPELLELTGGGLTYPPDQPDGLANALEALLLDPARAQALAHAGRQAAATHFAAPRMAQTIAAIAAGELARR